MANSLFNSIGNQSNPMANFIEQAKQFRNNFQGNPRTEVERLLQTGHMSQEQFNRLSQMAQQIFPMINN
jgi:hypothetical protein